MELTDGLGVPVVYDGVGKSTFEKSCECLQVRGTMISFGNSSGPLDPINVPKYIQPKSLFFTRPVLGHHSDKNELQEAGKTLFEKIK